jgi:protein TonB
MQSAASSRVFVPPAPVFFVEVRGVPAAAHLSKNEKFRSSTVKIMKPGHAPVKVAASQPAQAKTERAVPVIAHSFAAAPLFTTTPSEQASAAEVHGDGKVTGRPAAASVREEGSAEKAEFVGPGFNAAYLKNAPPQYPPLARRLKLQGRVLLAVLVDAGGRPQRVLVKESSGFSSLDEAALEAVEKWVFIPAKRGSKSVPASVDVPIRFRLT